METFNSIVASVRARWAAASARTRKRVTIVGAIVALVVVGNLITYFSR
jgi:type II secretory pathway component PulM